MTEGGSIQNFTIPNIENFDDDPIFSVPGDIAINWRYDNNGVRVALTGGHLSDENIDDDNTHGLGNHLCLKRNERAEEDNPNCKIEISNIQNCSFPLCGPKSQKAQGKNHGNILKSGPVYGNYAIYVSNSTAEFPADQKLHLEMKSKKINFMIALYHVFLTSGEKSVPNVFPLNFL